MSRIKPNQPCPCGSGDKFKKCCDLFLSGKAIDNAERLLRARYAALVDFNVKFLWESLHPMSPRKLNDTWNKFEREQHVIKNLNYRELIILDGNVSKNDQATIVYYVRVFDGEQDLSYLEEAQFKLFENKWYYFDGLRRSSMRIGCDPMSIKLGQLETLYEWESGLN